jgi:Domain of unknown function (DUF4386)
MTTRALPDVERPAPRSLVIWTGGLLLGGLVLSQVATMFHPGSADPNDHPRVFAEYAAGSGWIWVHFAQWASALVLLAGFVVLYEAVRRHAGGSVLLLLALGAALTTASAITVNMAVDGVALKHAVDAWVGAVPSDRPMRFAAAETVRWLEWAANSFFQMLLGLTIGLFGLAIVRSGIVSRWLGWLGVPAAASLVASGVTVAHHGFAASPLGLVAALLVLLMAGGIVVVGVRRPPEDAGISASGTHARGAPRSRTGAAG